MVIESAVVMCRAEIDARGLKFSLDLGPAAPYWVEADPRRLQQVFWNLLKNAIKFTPRGGRIGVRCHADDQRHVVVAVSDSGMGIEAESDAAAVSGLRAGRPFRRSAVRRAGAGAGDRQSDGRYARRPDRSRQRRPQPGRDVPRPAAAGRAAAGGPSALAPAVAKRAVRPLHILLVEDHQVTAKMIRMVLTEDGHTAETAGDVATALELAGRQRFGLLISDLGLPDGSGHDLIRELRARGHKFPAIASSATGRTKTSGGATRRASLSI